MHYSRAYVDRAASEEDGLLRFVAATEGVKGDGIELRMDGALLERYRANPIFGYGHQYGSRQDLPIGRATEVKLVGRSLRIGVEFDQGDEFAREVERKYRDGYMSAVSVGFEVHKWENDQGSYWRGGVAEEWELLEVSAVPVPMDADALVEPGRDTQLVLARALAGLCPEVRAGAVLSKSNKKLVSDAVAALNALLEAASPSSEEEPRETGSAADGADESRELLLEIATVREDTAEIRRFLHTAMQGLWEERGAIAAHNTAVAESSMGGPSAETAAPNDRRVLRYMHAWVDPDGDPDTKTAYKFPHHPPRAGSAAALNLVRNALSRLPQADIPETDRAGVERHLRNHLNAQEKAHPGEAARTEPDPEPAAEPEAVAEPEADPDTSTGPEPGGEETPEPAAPEEGVDADAARSLLAALTIEKEAAQ